MNKEKLIRGLKITVIIILVLAIGILSFIQWKGDFIIHRVMTSLQSQLQDSLQYQAVHMDAFSHFPCMSVQLEQTSLGSGKMRLLDHADMDIVIGLFPIFRNAVDVHRIVISDASLHVLYHDGRWTYDVFNHDAEKPVVERSAVTKQKKGWSTLVRQLELNRSQVMYDDGQGNTLDLNVAHALLKGNMQPELIDVDMEVDADMNGLRTTSFVLQEALPFNMNGHYQHDQKTEIQQLKNWTIDTEAGKLMVDGKIDGEPDASVYDLQGSWQKSNLNTLKKWFPEAAAKAWKAYTLSGESEGRFEIKGRSSKKESPAVVIKGVLKNGGFENATEKQEVKNVNVDFSYHTNDPDYQNKSSLKLVAKKKSTFGSDMNADVTMIDMDHPVTNLDLTGNFPAPLINLFTAPELVATAGNFEIEKFKIDRLNSSADIFNQLIKRAEIEFTANDLKCTYANNPIACSKGKIASSPVSGLRFAFDELNWDKAAAKDVSGQLQSKEDIVLFDCKGELSDGKVATKGTLQTSAGQKALIADWTGKGVDIENIMASFSNFDQTFITSENISGKADIWATTTIPMGDDWKIRTKGIVSKCAISIKDGQLRNLKTLEDFGDYVHVEDLRDIRFNELKNYLKIEDGKVYLPVMFIQSSAMNLSISGVHSFDQHILYNMKLNAGQALTNKLKKTDFRKDFKSAKKSGWINLYFVLEGTTSDVKYQQYRAAVISGFEQSAAMKEALRKDLVDHFGYEEVYWVEPNEWEDIPEYK